MTETTEVLGGRVTTYRNQSGDQVIAVQNDDTNNTTALSMTQGNIEEVIEMLERGGWDTEE